MNLVHVNIARALIEDVENVILNLTWIRTQYIIAIEDITWQLPKELEGSTAEKLIGCQQFLATKSEERDKELRCNKSLSYLNVSECRDMRDVVGNT